jgi:hypothetical protein
VTDIMWHFCPVDADGVPRLGHGDGREVRVGETLTVDGVIELCEHGLHACERVMDALKYASSRSALCRVTLGGTIMHDADKYVASERTVIAMLSAAETNALLRECARWCALQVIDLWDAPPVVRDYLATGDESLRDAAWAAASAAAWAAASAAASAAAWAAARGAASAAARGAARGAASAAARNAQDEWLTAEALRRVEVTP